MSGFTVAVDNPTPPPAIVATRKGELQDRVFVYPKAFCKGQGVDRVTIAGDVITIYCVAEAKP